MFIPELRLLLAVAGRNNKQIKVYIENSVKTRRGDLSSVDIYAVREMSGSMIGAM